MTDMRLYDIRVTVERVEGRSVCGLEVGDYFELTESSRLRIPAGKHFCLYALQAVLPLLPAKQRDLPDEDWLEQDTLVCCPDPEERVVGRPSLASGPGQCDHFVAYGPQRHSRRARTGDTALGCAHRTRL